MARAYIPNFSLNAITKKRLMLAVSTGARAGFKNLFWI
jgi:hypothetical protein